MPLTEFHFKFPNSNSFPISILIPIPHIGICETYRDHFSILDLSCSIELLVFVIHYSSKRNLSNMSLTSEHREQGPARNSEKISFSSFSTSHNNSSTKDLIPEEAVVFFPEGGLRAWLVVFGSWCALFASLGIMNTMGAFQQHISTHQLVGHEIAAVGWIFSLYAFLTFGVSLFVGPVFDKYGPRWLILSGSVLVTASMATIGVCQGASDRREVLNFK